MNKILTLNPVIPEEFPTAIWGDFSFISAQNQYLTAYERMGTWNSIAASDYIDYMEFQKRLDSF